jgi:hypothetical protein
VIVGDPTISLLSVAGLLHTDQRCGSRAQVAGPHRGGPRGARRDRRGVRRNPQPDLSPRCRSASTRRPSIVPHRPPSPSLQQFLADRPPSFSDRPGAEDCKGSGVISPGSAAFTVAMPGQPTLSHEQAFACLHLRSCPESRNCVRRTCLGGIRQSLRLPRFRSDRQAAAASTTGERPIAKLWAFETCSRAAADGRLPGKNVRSAILD